MSAANWAELEAVEILLLSLLRDIRPFSQGRVFALSCPYAATLRRGCACLPSR